jgi:hypothetical protein
MGSEMDSQGKGKKIRPKSLADSSGGAVAVPLGAAESNDFFISTINTANYTNDSINLIELNH